MDKNQAMWKRVIRQLKERKEAGFEEFFILTYQPVYQDIIQAVGQKEQAEKLLVDFYVQVYRELPDLPDRIDGEPEAVQWLESILYEFFEIQTETGGEDGILTKRLPEERAATLFSRSRTGWGLRTDRKPETGKRMKISRRMKKRKNGNGFLRWV